MCSALLIFNWVQDWIEHALEVEPCSRANYNIRYDKTDQLT